MRHYEMMIILEPEMDEKTLQATLDKFLNVIKEASGTINNVDMWGKRRLAYDINKKSEGIYVVVDMNATPAAVAELDRQLNLNESIVRTKLVRPEQRTPKVKAEAL